MKRDLLTSAQKKMAQKVNQLFMKRKNTFARTFIGIFVRA